MKWELMNAEEVAQTKVYREWGMTDEEYEKVVALLSRKPGYTEIGIYSAMWSEHCSYKNSKPILRKFYTEGPQVLQGPGEGAGIVDIGDGQAVVFKIESHNSPSAVEPYEGAATGLGGILRDVFSMGATPIAGVNSLRFGELTDDRTRYLFKEAVRGISDYGSKMGVPTIAGEVKFDEAYHGSPLVNAMVVGLLNHEDIKKGVASGIGNKIIYLGAKTGRDGINGATFSSDAVLGDNSDQGSAVQAGNPYLEKRVMDACLELIHEHSDIIIGVQDMGAAGLVSSSSEMASSADAGVVLYTDRVPQREEEMTPYEILLSESQERMLLCVKAGGEEVVAQIAEKYQLPVAVIGEVTSGNLYQVYHEGELVVDVPVRTLADDAPVYEKPWAEPERMKHAVAYVPEDFDLTEMTKALLNTADLASRQPVIEQFDTTSLGQTVVRPGSDAGIVHIPNSDKGIAITVDCNGRYVYLDPEIGGQMTVAEAARNIVASGGQPLAITDGLNFGNIKDLEVFYELKFAAQGISTAAERLQTPVISGNVSLNNENEAGSIYPTPMVGMVGLIPNIHQVTPMHVQQAGDALYVVGKTGADYSGSVLQKYQTGKISGPLHFDLDEEVRQQQLIQQMNEKQLLQSAHDLSEGGLLMGLLQKVFQTPYGLQVTINKSKAELFSESASRFVISIAADHRTDFEAYAKEMGINCEYLGVVTEEEMIAVQCNNDQLHCPKEELEAIWKDGLSC
ncbi:phosphoribosylformylglycinamidine synthase subunit PurL [Allofustis seminis]|uniref:phosphoribosylformylglycinamidine synthase subunit PurL n=1 Tax=Allofustis seminis TaxID=166939 RepID=UPI00036E83C8|nr:phosphoribosylformylglycinamidine synthase subunit PurL [Allofustis seminis]